MKLLKLDDESLQAVFRTESGMDFAIVKGFSTAVPLHSVLVVRGNGYAAPIERHEGIYTVADMVEGHPLPRADADVWMIALSNIVPVTKLTSVSLPRGYLPARGWDQLRLLTTPASFVSRQGPPTSSIVAARWTMTPISPPRTIGNS
jgi:hypothetical protein